MKNLLITVLGFILISGLALSLGLTPAKRSPHT